MFLPIACSIGSPRANAVSLPPTMKVSVAAVAPPTPPDTGASSISKPATRAASVTVRALSTSIVEQSISSGARTLHRLDQAALVQPHLAHVLTGRQHGDDDVGAARRLRRAARRLHAGGRQRLHGTGIDVVADDAMAGLHQVGRHRRAHVAQADEADRRHAQSPRGSAGSNRIRRLAASAARRSIVPAPEVRSTRQCQANIRCRPAIPPASASPRSRSIISIG